MGSGDQSQVAFINTVPSCWPSQEYFYEVNIFLEGGIFSFGFSLPFLPFISVPSDSQQELLNCSAELRETAAFQLLVLVSLSLRR